MARKLKILRRIKERPMLPTTGETFSYEDAGPLRTEDLLRDPSWSLCCFDFHRRLAIFAQTPADVDLSNAPFHYIAQYDSAKSLASMPLAEFEKTGQGLPWPEHVLFVPNTGRCGSTLLSKAFAAVPGVLSISESDDLSQITFSVLDGTLDNNAAVSITRAAMKWRGAQPYKGRPVQCLVNKPRSQATALSNILHKAVPRLKFLFMYRAADAWLRSANNLYRAAVDMDDAETVEKMRSYWSKFDPLVEEYTRERGPLHPLAFLVLNWCHHAEIYLDLFEAGLDCRALRYEDLVSSPREILEQVYDFAGLQVIDWPAVLGTFENDAQEGSPISRGRIKAVGKTVPEEAMTDAMEIVRSRRRLRSPDVILPATIGH